MAMFREMEKDTTGYRYITDTWTTSRLVSDSFCSDGIANSVCNAFIFLLEMVRNPCPAEPGYTLPLHSVDPDQLASEEAN